LAGTKKFKFFPLFLIFQRPPLFGLGNSLGLKVYFLTIKKGKDFKGQVGVGKNPINKKLLPSSLPPKKLDPFTFLQLN